jgi:hypothetical protein
VFTVLFLFSAAVFQLRSEQTEIIRKLVEELTAKAEAGDADSEYRLGLCYYNGEGVDKDFSEAVKWYRKAAEQNYAKAQNDLGYCYGKGQGVTKDEVEAVKWYRKAAKQNLAAAQCNLAVCYYNGRGMPKDHVTARQWFREAAEQNYANAQYMLGLCYAKGQGVAKDFVESYKWMLLAAGQGNKDAKEFATKLENNISRKQIVEGQKLARNFKAREVLSRPLKVWEMIMIVILWFVVIIGGGVVLFIVGLPYSILWTYTKARQKGYRPPGASLISVAGWAAGIIGAIIWEVYKVRSGLRWHGDDIADFYINLVLIYAIVFVGVISVTGILLLTLPRRNPRVFGPRQLRFSWSRFALFASGACLAPPAIAVVLWAVGKVELEWMLLALVIFIPFSLGAIYCARAILRPYETSVKSPLSIEQYLTEDPRPPVLYLRPFKMDLNAFAERDGHWCSFEVYFSEALKQLGPFVLLGNPEDYVPRLALEQLAVRLYASDTDWIQKVDELARRSSCIVVETARSDNLRLEYEHLRREGLHEKLFVFTGHQDLKEARWFSIWQRMRIGTLHVGWQKFSEDLALLGYDIGFSDPGPGSVMTFDAAGRGILLTKQAESAAEFVEPIRAWIASREKIERLQSPN